MLAASLAGKGSSASLLQRLPCSPKMNGGLESTVVFVLLWATASTTEECGHSFVFPSLESSFLVTEENKTISFPFRLDTNCSFPENFKITVSKRLTQKTNSTHIVESDVCNIRHSNGTCHVSYRTTMCSCIEETSMYNFTKKAKRTDNALWVWRTNTRLAKHRELIFSIKYPARITKLELNSEHFLLVNGGDVQVDVLCTWENGNPPVFPRLLNRHGVEMEGSIYSSGQIRYRFPAVGCHDAGLIRCEAPGASQNKTAMLLVKCSPEISLAQSEVVVLLNQSTALEVTVLSYTKEITCQILSPTTKRTDYCSIASVTGAPPDLTLTVRLDNVKKEEEGQWRLELTNGAGTGYNEFLVRVKDIPFEMDFNESSPFPSTTGRVLVDEERVNDITYSGPKINFSLIISIAIVAAAAIVITAIVVCMRRGRRTDANKAQRGSEASLALPREEQIVHPTDSESSQETNFYWEIPDGSGPPSPEPPRPCLRPALPADYLHPSVSREVAEDTDNSRTAVPLYDNSQLRPVETNDVQGTPLARSDIA